jgi:hypothetical protein
VAPLTVATWANKSDGITSTNHTMTLPSGIEAGDLLIAWLRVNGNTAITWPAGWTEFFEDASDSTDDVTGAARRIADGGEGSTIAPTTAISAKSGGGVARITGHDPSTAPVAGAVAFSSYGTLSPPGGAQDYLWLAFAGRQGSASPTSGVPNGWTELGSSTSGAGTEASSIGTRSARLVSFAASIAPSGATNASTTFLVAVRSPMDVGMTAAVGGYFDNMQQRFRRDIPAISVRNVPASIAAFIDDLFTDASVKKPVGDLYIGTHAGSDGYLFVRLFRGQVDANGSPSDVTEYEVLDQALGPANHARIPDSLVGYQRGTPPAADPPPTHSVHIKGCNIGRDRFLPTPAQPVAPFLTRLKQVFGDSVNVTAPKHFHGLLPEDNHNGIFEYMEQELIVRTKAVKAEPKFGGTKREGFRGFATRDQLIEAYKKAHLNYYDGTPIPEADWATTLVPHRLFDDRRIAMTLPLGRTIENLPAITVHKQFRIELEPVDWTFTPAGSVPKAKPAQLAMLRASIAADARFAATHPWPAYERRGFADFNAFWDGHDWSCSVSGGDLVCKGRRITYTIMLPIVDRSVTPAADRPIIFNFYPGVGSSESPIVTGLVESDNRFFGRG